jgi:hypothetical protein
LEGIPLAGCSSKLRDGLLGRSWMSMLMLWFSLIEFKSVDCLELPELKFYTNFDFIGFYSREFVANSCPHGFFPIVWATG